jgi:hypothetical protein
MTTSAPLEVTAEWLMTTLAFFRDNCRVIEDDVGILEITAE